MERNDYVVKRKDIYVGEVVKASGIYKRVISGREPSGQLDIRNSIVYRNMIFTPTEDKFARDLLYDTEDYPILNGTEQGYVLGLDDGTILIRDYYNIDELLEYFCYSEELNINDVVKLYNTFFTGLFSKQNPELFGRQAVPAEQIKFYENNVLVSDSKKLEKHHNEYRKLQKQGKGLYISTKENVLSGYYWYLLQKNKSSFRPNKKEGKRKQLVKL